MQSPRETRSVSLTETIKGSHSFTIKGYSLTKGIGIGEAITSDAFSVGGHQWRILFYPDGKYHEYDDSEYVSVYVELDSHATDVRALFGLTLFDQSGDGKHRVDCTKYTSPYTLANNQNMWGYVSYFRRDLLEKSDYLKDDCLKFHCTVGVVVTTMQSPQIDDSIDVPKSDICSQYLARRRYNF